MWQVPPPAPTSEQLEADKDIAPSMVEILKILTLTNVQEQARAMTQAMLNRACPRPSISCFTRVDDTRARRRETTRLSGRV